MSKESFKGKIINAVYKSMELGGDINKDEFNTRFNKVWEEEIEPLEKRIEELDNELIEFQARIID